MLFANEHQSPADFTCRMQIHAVSNLIKLQTPDETTPSTCCTSLTPDFSFL